MYELSLYYEKPIELWKNKTDYFGEPVSDNQYLTTRIIFIFHFETLTLFLVYDVF